MLITFEGIDGSGKSTQVTLLEQSLKAWGTDALLTRQPGGTEIGQQIRRILLDPQNRKMTSTTELLLYMADRIQHVEEVIRPALKTGKLVLCDRYHDATLAYQGGGRGLDLTWLKPLEDQLELPALTLFFRLAPALAHQRLNLRNQAKGEEPCRLESEERAFFEATDHAYMQLAARAPERFLVIDANRPVEVIHNEVVQKVLKRIES
ncbi:MAG: dTMP kinase [bacterium]|nr:dTMP kinase [bacterium]